MLENDATGALQRLLKYPPIEDIREVVAMGLSFQTYILGGCATSKPSIIPGSIKTFNVTIKPSLAVKTRELAPPTTSPPAFDPLLRPAGLMRSAPASDPLRAVPSSNPLLSPLQSSPKAESSPTFPDEETTPQQISVPEDLPPQPVVVSEESPSKLVNSLAEPNEPTSREFLKSSALSGLESAIECLEDQIRQKTFSEVGIMRALDTLERVKDLLLRELLTNK